MSGPGAPLRLVVDATRGVRWSVMIGAAAVAAVCWPLLTYSVALATFGAAHVLWELRYVSARFGARLGAPMGGALVIGLAAIAALRGAHTLDWLGPGAVNLELSVVVALLLLPLPRLLRRAWPVGALALIAPLAFGLGTALSPTHTLLVMAVAHNLTPIGFFAEALRGEERRRLLGAAAVLFLGVPALIATGLPADLAHAAGWYAPERSVLPTGPLARHLGAYLPFEWHEREWAAYAFSAVVFGQCMHYLAVLDVLPGLQGGDARHGRWPHAAVGGLALLGCAGLGYAFTLDFSAARLWYGPMAAVHAWLELPVLMIFLLSLPFDESVVGPGAATPDLR